MVAAGPDPPPGRCPGSRGAGHVVGRGESVDDPWFGVLVAIGRPGIPVRRPGRGLGPRLWTYYCAGDLRLPAHHRTRTRVGRGPGDPAHDEILLQLRRDDRRGGLGRRAVEAERAEGCSARCGSSAPLHRRSLVSPTRSRYRRVVRAVRGPAAARPGVAAIELVRQAEARGIALPWKLADRVAITHLYLGEPAQARKYWEQTHAPPSTALRLARIAQAEMASTDFDAAEKTFRAAIGLDKRLGEAWFGLALLELQLGRADATLADCHQGLSCNLTEPQREALDKFKALVDRFASSGRGPDGASP